MRTLPRVLALTLGCALTASAWAVPLQLPTQGRLLDATGVPLDGPHDITLTIYDAPAGGAVLWTDTFEAELDQGYYALVLGSGLQLDEELFHGDTLFLAVRLDDAAELPVRQPLLSVPFAIRAGHAEQARDLVGGVVDAAEIRVNGTTVFDDTGALIGHPDTLAELSCSVGEVAEYDGSAWVCASNPALHEHDATEVITGTFEIGRLPVGTGSEDVAAGDHIHQLGTLPGELDPEQLPSDMGARVDAWVTDGALDLASGTTVGGAAIVTGTAYADSNAVAAMGTNGASNPLNHDRYLDSEAVAAMGSKGPSNPLNHDAYENADAVAAMGSNGASNPLNHDRYANSEAVAAMGSNGAGNPLNHDRYANSEAVAAMGTKGSTNALNHDRYTDTEARAAARGRYNWKVCQTDSDNGNDTGTVIMNCAFRKEANDSYLKVTYSDNMRVYGHGGWCQWEIEFDTRSCTSPVPNIRAAVYSTNDSGTRNNNHEARTVVGVCDTTGAGHINAGDHTIRVRISNGNTDCYTGWNQTSMLLIEEIF